MELVKLGACFVVLRVGFCREPCLFAERLFAGRRWASSSQSAGSGKKARCTNYWRCFLALCWLRLGRNSMWRSMPPARAARIQQAIWQVRQLLLHSRRSPVDLAIGASFAWSSLAPRSFAHLLVPTGAPAAVRQRGRARG